MKITSPRAWPIFRIHEVKPTEYDFEIQSDDGKRRAYFYLDEEMLVLKGSSIGDSIEMRRFYLNYPITKQDLLEAKMMAVVFALKRRPVIERRKLKPVTVRIGLGGNQLFDNSNRWIFEGQCKGRSAAIDVQGVFGTLSLYCEQHDLRRQNYCWTYMTMEKTCRSGLSMCDLEDFQQRALLWIEAGR